MFASVTANPDLLRREGLRAGGAAATLYLVVLTFLAAGGWSRRVEIPDPELPDPIPPLRVFVEPPLERASAGGGGGTPRFSDVKREPRQLVAPLEIPPEISASGRAAATPDDGEDLGWEPSGDPSGDRNGSEMTAVGREEGTPGLQGPYRTGGGVKAPILVDRVDPLYPEPARRLRQQGRVELQAIITAEGTVEELRVVGSAFPLLDEAALAAVRQWRYRPGTLNGRAVRILLTVTVHFRLH